MSAMDVDAEPLEEEEAVPLDELVLAFEALDESTSDLTSYASIMSNERTDDAAIKIKERCIYRIAKIHTEKKNLEEVGALMKNQSDFFGMIPKAKTAKIVRNILDLVARIPDSIDIQMKLCEDLVHWCEKEKRTFLRQRIEARQCSLFLQKKKNSEGQELVTKLLGELKKLDDKQMLTEVHLTESRLYHALENIPKAKASLTASRSAANSIYVVPLLQAELDEMSGILCCEEGDHSTAFSYFQEAFDAYDGTLDSAAVRVLKYMVLSKTLSEKPGEAEACSRAKRA
jgi:26S proteasome regulatory subunit N6